MVTQHLLLEIGCEELPAKSLTALAGQLRDQIVTRLAEHGLLVEPNTAMALWTPRRLTVSITAVPTQGAAQNAERRGPAVAQAMDASGQPSKALIGFAASCNTTVDKLDKLETDKGAWYVHRAIKPGASLADVIVLLVNDAIKNLPIPKPMRWGVADLSFLRPVHWVVLMLDADVIPGVVLGKQTDRITYGHRFHAPTAISLKHANDYSAALASAFVCVDAGERRQRIRTGATELAGQIGGLAQIREELLDEVSNLCEWPMPIRCSIPAQFMRLPPETIVTTIETHQKYFPIVDKSGALMPGFVAVANIASSDENQIRLGNERVTKPRLTDAAFFYDQDLKTPLASLQEGLAKVTFQAKLGSVWDKVERVAELAQWLAPQLGADAALAVHAARLSKCDLLSRMVGEFPELQGLMGRRYGGAGSAIASSALGKTLALAERLDTLAGIFAVGLKPTGNKDAFALRRTALGLARTIIEGELTINLPQALEKAVLLVPAQSLKDYVAKLAKEMVPDSSFLAPMVSALNAPAVAELYHFILERLRAYYADSGIGVDLFDAVASRKPTDLLDFDLRLKALLEFKKLPECAALIAANKRIANIMKKSDQPLIVGQQEQIDPSKFEHDAEKSLFSSLQSARAKAEPDFAQAQYVRGLTTLAELQKPIDAFFEGVMVNAENLDVRRNRMNLLNATSQLFLHVGDIAQLS
jgi:glycyl-tRNA synthetase beta chain